MTATGVLDLWQGTAEEFEKNLQSFPADTCGRLQDAAIQIESAIKVVYRVTALEARSTEDLSEVARLWGAMGEVCQQAVKKLSALSQQQPDCGIGIYLDRILDLANKCRRLQEMHRSE
jgi:hypothetical protein